MGLSGGYLWSVWEQWRGTVGRYLAIEGKLCFFGGRGVFDRS